MSSKLTREEFRKQKDLEDARKAGNAPAEVDEEGREINPHIPNYMSKAPWYLDTGRPTLSHQRLNPDLLPQSTPLIQQTGIKRKREAFTKFRKGACENCGAMTHSKKDCVEKPRKLGAKWTNKNIQPDEDVKDERVGYEGKRDRWEGYLPEDQKKLIEEFEELEELKRKQKEKQLEEELLKKSAVQNDLAVLSDDEGEVEDEFKYEEGEMPGQKLDDKSRTTIRNLRLREDTAKYLLNLDTNSAYYDPKTRSMRENPNADKNPLEVSFAGDNFLRHTGDSKQMAKTQLFAWEVAGKGIDVHLEADPTRTALLQKEYEKSKKEVQSKISQKLLDRYGQQPKLDPSLDPNNLKQTEIFFLLSQKWDSDFTLSSPNKKPILPLLLPIQPRPFQFTEPKLSIPLFSASTLSSPSTPRSKSSSKMSSPTDDTLQKRNRKRKQDQLEQTQNELFRNLDLSYDLIHEAQALEKEIFQLKQQLMVQNGQH